MYKRPRMRGYTPKAGTLDYEADVKYLVRREVFNRDDFTCQDCNRKFTHPDPYTGRLGIDGLTLGHIIPRALGGQFMAANLAAQCDLCNHKLGNNIWAKQLRRVLTNYTLR